MLDIKALTTTSNLGAYIAGKVLPSLGRIQWLFKEANTATQAVDKQGTRSGTVYAGRCYDFDGTDDYISHPTVTLSGDFTITINLKLDALTSTRTVSYFNSANSIKVLNTGAIRFEVNNNVITSSTGAISATTAQEIVISRTGSSVDISVDGTSVGSGTESGDFKASLIGYNGTGEYMDGKLFSLQLGSELQYNCEEGDGTTAFDSSGNGNHGTITNATLSTFHTTDADVSYSWLNQVGFTESDGSTYYLNNDDTGLIASGVLIPRDESDTTKCTAFLSGGTQASLDQAGLVKLNADLVESNCGTFDGSNDQVIVSGSTDFDLNVNNDWTVYGWVSFDAVSNFKSWSGRKTGSEGFQFDQRGSGKFGGSLTDGITTVAFTSNTARNTGELYFVVYTHDGTAQELNIYINGVSDITTVDTSSLSTFSYSTADSLYIGARSGGSNAWDGTILNIGFAGVTVTEAEALAAYNNGGTFSASVISSHNALYPFSEGSGTTIYDVSGNDNHGTATNITESSFWGTTQDEYHYNITNGFEHYDDDATGLDIIRVPYKSDGTQITPTISGYTKNQNNPAGAWHNDAETKLKMSVVAPSLKDAAFWYSSGTPQARGYSDIVDNYADGNVTFADVSVTDKKKNLVTYDSAQSGSALSDIQKFLNH